MTTPRIAVVSAGLSNPSSTRMLADRLLSATREQLDLLSPDAAVSADADVFEIRDFAHDITNNLLTGFASPALETMLNAVVSADALIVAIASTAWRYWPE